MNTPKRLFVIMTALMAAGLLNTAHAADEASTESKLKVEDVKPKNKVKGDIDEDITNARMRASSGSKSKYSLSMGIAYDGGTIGKPFGEKRPDIVGNPEEEDSTEISGSFSARYRMTKNDSFTVGAGFGILTPFQGDVSRNEDQSNVSNPRVGYSRVYKLGRFQTISSGTLYFGTSDSWDGIDLNNVLALDQNMLTTIPGASHITVGASLVYQHYIYGNDNRDGLTAYKTALYPYAEYALSDKYQLRTVFGYFNYRHKRSTGDKSPLVGMEKQQSYQSVGVNMVITRDIFLYPNIQFVPDDIDSEKTNVALSATINMF